MQGTTIPKKNAANVYSAKNTFTELSAYGVNNDTSYNVTLGFERTSSTDLSGLSYIPAVSVSPYGTPTAKTNFAHILWDTFANKLWIYSSGAWNGAGGGTGDVNPTPDTLAQRSSTGQINDTSFNTTSDRRLKGEVKDIEDALEKVLQLSGKSYFFNLSKDTREYGFIAQEVAEVIP